MSFVILAGSYLEKPMVERQSMIGDAVVDSKW
jgi:hypothetical protein